MIRRIIMAGAMAAAALIVGGLQALPSQASTLPAVWVGSPLQATWPNADGCAGATFPSSTCSLPSVHWWLARAPQGDWAADLQHVSRGQGVYVYAAPQDTSISITARSTVAVSRCEFAVSRTVT